MDKAEVSGETMNELCRISSVVSMAGVDMIACTHAAYYMAGNTDMATIIHQLKMALSAVRRLDKIEADLSNAIDEIEGIVS